MAKRPGTRARAKNRSRRSSTSTLSARLVSHVTLDVHAGGKVLASVEDHSLSFGTLSPAAADRARMLSTGLPLASFASGAGETDQEIDRLVRRLARHGLLEYSLSSARHGEDQVVIEAQVPNYWPEIQPLDHGDRLVLSRFAYLRRRGNEMVLESPLANALFKICDPKIAATLTFLSMPRQLKQLHRPREFLGAELLGLLVDCRILFKLDSGDDPGLRPSEGDDNLVVWDFHDLLFHARSTEGRHANPLGGVFPYVGWISPLPAARPAWPGNKIDLRQVLETNPRSLVATLLRQRHSVRHFDDGQPITLAELSRFLDASARVLSRRKDSDSLGEGGPTLEYTARPYPSAGSCYELELYLAVDKCEGLPRGFYHYDADAHTVVAIDARAPELDALLTGAQFAMGESAVPQVLITITARFGRVSWKYSSIAYGLILKDVGVLTQTFYLIATDMGLGGCAIGSVNVDLFAKMTGIEFHVEGPVGQFALGRPAP